MAASTNATASADADVVAGSLNAFVQGFAASHLRRERFADAAASNLIVGMNHLMERGRHTFSIISDLIVNAIAGDLTGGDDKLSERILNARSAQFQPQEATMVDPNYRVPPPSPTKAS